jgi:lysophospholipase L1-like esterase
MSTISRSTVAFAIAIRFLAEAHAAPSLPMPEHWITSWYAASQSSWDKTFPLPMNVPSTLDDVSTRETVRLSAGGRRVRLVFSNQYGLDPVAIAGVRVRVMAGTEPERTLEFSGHPAASIPPGATLISDPLEVTVPALAQLTVTSHLPSPTAITTFHWGAQQTMQLVPGDATAASRASPSRVVGGRLFLNAVMVEATESSHTVVALGDSITDGNGSTPDLDRRWPDFLARRLAPYGIGVANAGISGARLLKDGMGQNAMARLAQDVLSQPHVSDVIVLLGINDIGWPGSPFAPVEPPVQLEALTTGYLQLAATAHARGIRVTVGTLPPFEGALEGTPYAGHYSPEKERLRRRLNQWIRTAGAFDAIVDFDAALRDPARPQRLRPEFDSGDHLHPGDAGYQAMAAAIDVAPLIGQRGQPAPAKEAAR